LVKNENLNALSQPTEYLANETKSYLDPVIKYFSNLSVEERSQLRRKYGTGGKTEYWRTLQQVIQETMREFNPEGLAQYKIDSSKQYNTKSFEMIRDIETHLKKYIRENLEVEYGELSWWKKGVPFKVYEAAEKEASKANRDIEDPEKEIEPWDKLHLIDYREIILHNWRKLFENKFTIPDSKGNKEEKTKWLEKLNRIRNQNFHVYSVTEEEFNFLRELHSWLFSKR